MSSSASPSLLRGPAVLIIWGRVRSLGPIEERHLNDWWTNEHLPERLALPGFHRTRRYYHPALLGDNDRPLRDEATPDRDHPATESVSHYLVTYEVSSLDALTSPEYMHALNNPTPGTQKYMRVMSSMHRSACRVLGSLSQREFGGCKDGGVGGTLRHATFAPPSAPDRRAKLRDWLARDGWSALQATYRSLLAMHLLEHDGEASRAGSSTRSYDQVSFQNAGGSSDVGPLWMLLLEFTEPLDAPFAYHNLDCPDFDHGLENHGVDLARKEDYGLFVVMEE